MLPVSEKNIQEMKRDQAYWNVLIELENMAKGLEEGVEKKPIQLIKEEKKRRIKPINLGKYVKAGVQR